MAEETWRVVPESLWTYKIIIVCRWRTRSSAFVLIVATGAASVVL